MLCYSSGELPAGWNKNISSNVTRQTVSQCFGVNDIGACHYLIWANHRCDVSPSKQIKKNEKTIWCFMVSRLCDSVLVGVSHQNTWSFWESPWFVWNQEMSKGSNTCNSSIFEVVTVIVPLGAKILFYIGDNLGCMAYVWEEVKWQNSGAFHEGTSLQSTYLSFCLIYILYIFPGWCSEIEMSLQGLMVILSVLTAATSPRNRTDTSYRSYCNHHYMKWSDGHHWPLESSSIPLSSLKRPKALIYHGTGQDRLQRQCTL